MTVRKGIPRLGKHRKEPDFGTKCPEVAGSASGVVQEGLSEIAYKALPAALVDKVKVDVGNMKVGDTIRVKDLEIAKDKEIDLSTDPEAVVATVTAVHNVVPETETEETAEE